MHAADIGPTFWAIAKKWTLRAGEGCGVGSLAAGALRVPAGPEIAGRAEWSLRPAVDGMDKGGAQVHGAVNDQVNDHRSHQGRCIVVRYLALDSAPHDEPWVSHDAIAFPVSLTHALQPTSKV